MEKRKWDERVKSMRSSTEVATHDLESKKSDELYSLKEEYRAKLRAKTAEFARASADIEKFFTTLLDQVKETRVTIMQKKDDVEGAIEEYQKLTTSLTEALPQFEEVLVALNVKSTEVLKDAKKFDETLASKSGETSASVDSEIDQRKERLVKLERERQESEEKLNELLSSVIKAIDRMEGRIEKRLLDYQSEVLNLQRMTLENISIKDLAPLTHLDIFLIVAEYSNGERKVFPPGLMVEDRFSIPLSYQTLHPPLEEFILASISRLKENDTTFQSRFDSAVAEGNVFEDPENFDKIETGLKDLQFRQMLHEGTYETIIRTLKRCMNM
jgi:hypothetical protein